MSEREQTVYEWAQEEKARVDRFVDYYLTERSKTGADPEVWPNEMPPGEWDEQYRSWEDYQDGGRDE